MKEGARDMGDRSARNEVGDLSFENKQIRLSQWMKFLTSHFQLLAMQHHGRSERKLSICSPQGPARHMHAVDFSLTALYGKRKLSICS
jgi:hypothetical protein